MIPALKPELVAIEQFRVMIPALKPKLIAI